METNRWILGFASLVVVYGAIAHGQEKPVPDVWKEIEREVKAIDEKVKMDGSGDYEAVRLQLDGASRKLAARCGRLGIEAMVRNIDYSTRLPYSKGAYLDAIALRVFVDVADPRGEHRLMQDLGQKSVGWEGRVSLYGVAVAAIEVYHDTRARDLLLDVALNDGAYASGEGRWLSPCIYAMGFLRSYDAAGIRPNVEVALRAETAKKKPNGQASMRENYLRSLLSSWDYASALNDAAERDRYRNFERRFWRAWALAGGWGDRRADVPFTSASRILERYWKESDEHFLLHIFEQATSTIEETRIAEHLAHQLSATGKKRLEEIANGNSAKAPFARRALEEAARSSQGRGDKGGKP